MAGEAVLLPTVPLGLTVPRMGLGPAEHRCGHGGRQSFGVSRFLGSVDFWGRQIFGVTALRCHQQLSPSGVPPCLARVPALCLILSSSSSLPLEVAALSGAGIGSCSSGGNSGQVSRGRASLNWGCCQPWAALPEAHRYP